MAKSAAKTATKKSDTTKVLGIRVEGSEYDFVTSRMAALATTTVNSEGKLGASNGEVLIDLLSNSPSNREMTNFIQGDFVELMQTLIQRVGEQTEAINRNTDAVTEVRNLFVTALLRGDTSEAVAALSAMTSRSNGGRSVEHSSSNDDFAFMVNRGALVEQNEDDLIADFSQIKTSTVDDAEGKNGINEAGMLTQYGTIRQTRNFKQRMHQSKG